MNKKKLLRTIEPNKIAFCIAQSILLSPLANGAVINVDAPETGGCTIVDAIVSANENSAQGSCENSSTGLFGQDVINLPSNTTFNYVTPFECCSFPYSGPSALPKVTTPLTIMGNGSTIQRSSNAEQLFRVLDLDGESANLTLSDITLSGGNVDNGSTFARFSNSGGAILLLRGAKINLDSVTLSGNSARRGGAISAIFSSEVSLNDCVVSTNIASGYGGGIAANVSSPLALTNTEVSDNSAGIGGGILATIGANLTIESSIVSNNTANTEGGGIYAGGTGASMVEISYSRLSDNFSQGVGGGASISSGKISGSTITNNSASSDGGGLFIGGSPTNNSFLGDVTIQDSFVSGNLAVGRGGGIYSNISYQSGLSIRVTDSTLSRNSAYVSGGAFYANSSIVDFSYASILNNYAIDNGGGVFARGGEIAMANSTAFKNTAALKGGGLFLRSSSTTISNSTLSSNSANLTGGAIYSTLGGTAILRNTTLVNNSAVLAGGLYSNSGVPDLRNTVVCGSGGGVCCGVFATAFCDNWFSDNSCGAAASGTPKLGTIQFNGGPTLTHAPLSGSGLIGAGNPSVCQSAVVGNRDQRGEIRSLECSIGSVDQAIDPKSDIYVIPLENGKNVIFGL